MAAAEKEAGTNPADLVRLLLGQGQGQEGREMSDAALEQLAYMLAAAQGQTGRTLSDEDLEYYRDLIGNPIGRRMKVGKPGYNRRTIRRAGGGGIRSLKYNG